MTNILCNDRDLVVVVVVVAVVVVVVVVVVFVAVANNCIVNKATFEVPN